jgi:hypothetical protein
MPPPPPLPEELEDEEDEVVPVEAPVDVEVDSSPEQPSAEAIGSISSAAPAKRAFLIFIELPAFSRSVRKASETFSKEPR